MTPLQQLLIERIQTTGPMTVADYMAECLLHPIHGYYAKQDPFGQSGDFTTAPEISQMFGELIGLSLAQTWINQGKPANFTLAELGPGRGTLMADILRATRAIPGFADALDLHLVEASPALRAIQERTIGHPAAWHDRAETLPDAPLFIIANEFFDALPIRQFQRAEKGWQEHLVGCQNDELQLGLGTALPLARLEHRLDDTKSGDIVETCDAITPIFEEIAGRIHTYGGAALIIDYGDWRSLGDTLQALQSHQFVSPFQNPGDADITAHVDFEIFADQSKVTHTKLTPQGVFLERLGITQRAQDLAKNLNGKQLDAHISAHRRLTHPSEMGTLFKVLGLIPKGALPPPGLEL